MNFHHIFVFLKKQTKTTRGTTHMQLHILKLLSAKLSNYINCDNVWHTTILQSNNQNRSVIFFFSYLIGCLKIFMLGSVVPYPCLSQSLSVGFMMSTKMLFASTVDLKPLFQMPAPHTKSHSESFNQTQLASTVR